MVGGVPWLELSGFLPSCLSKNHQQIAHEVDTSARYTCISRTSAERIAGAKRGRCRRRDGEHQLLETKCSKRPLRAPAAHDAAPGAERWPPRSHGTRRSAPRPAAPVARRSRDFSARRAARAARRPAERPRRRRAAPDPISHTGPQERVTTKHLVRDLLHPSASEENGSTSSKGLVQSPNSSFSWTSSARAASTSRRPSARQTPCCAARPTTLCQPTGAADSRRPPGCAKYCTSSARAAAAAWGLADAVRRGPSVAGVRLRWALWSMAKWCFRMRLSVRFGATSQRCFASAASAKLSDVQQFQELISRCSAAAASDRYRHR